MPEHGHWTTLAACAFRINIRCASVRGVVQSSQVNQGRFPQEQDFQEKLPVSNGSDLAEVELSAPLLPAITIALPQSSHVVHAIFYTVRAAARE
jgi:hypothetical protein